MISLRDARLFTKVIPSKIFESTGTGFPMVVSCPEGEGTGKIRDTKSGVVVPLEDPELLAACVRQLYEKSERLQKPARASGNSAKLYDRAQQARLMLALLLPLSTRVDDLHV
jgi:hypothetical protein